MVGVFHRIVRGASGDQRNALQQTMEDKQALAVTLKEALGSGTFDLMEEFAPVEHPVEPPDNDKPIRCPAPEPCIVHAGCLDLFQQDGRIWKERISAHARLRASEYPLARENSLPTAYQRRPKLEHNSYLIPSFSAPEKQLLKILDEGIPKF